MSTPLKVVEKNVHEVQVDNQALIFHVPSSALFAADSVTQAVLGKLREASMDTEELANALTMFPRQTVTSTVNELLALQMLSDGTPLTPDIPVQQVSQVRLDTVVLNINTGCNLSCTYCYKEDLAVPSKGTKMDYDTAIASVEMLLRESPDEPRYTVVFFGGEPLTHKPLIEKVVAYCEKRLAALGKSVDFVMTTNATLLTESWIEFLDKHRFGLSVSIDGPKTVHDRNRITVGGQGTYDVVRKKAEMLLSKYRSRPVGARVTLTRGITDVETIWNHLFNELGFAEVGFAPVTSGDITSYNLTGDEVVEVFENMKTLGRYYLEEALQHRNIGFSNMHQMLTDIHEGHKKSLPCGAGYKMLAVDHAGDLNLCHRFTGSDLDTFGNVHGIVQHKELNSFLSKRLDRTETGCDTCHIRNLCSGGCYHESYVQYNDPSHPTYYYCDLMRDWVDFCIKIYAEIMMHNPAFIDQFITPRKEHFYESA